MEFLASLREYNRKKILNNLGFNIEIENFLRQRSKVYLIFIIPSKHFSAFIIELYCSVK